MPRKKYRREKSRMLGIYLENFQSIRRPTFINCQGLTFLYGPNSAGKSAVIDALRFFQLAADLDNRWFLDRKLVKEKPNQNKKPKSGSIDTVVGLDYQQGNLDFIDYGASELWSKRQLSYFDEYAHVQFHSGLKGKRVSVRFPEFTGIKILIDSLELFDIDYHSLAVDERHRPTLDDSKVDHNFDAGYGIKINKKHPCFELLKTHIEDFSEEFGHGVLSQTNHWASFVSEDTECITIRGLHFELAMVEKVAPYSGLDETLFYEYPKKGLKGIDPGFRNFLREHFDPKSDSFQKYLAERRSLYWKIEELAKFLDLIVQGFLLHIGDAIRVAHCRGDRQLLSSEYPFYVDLQNPKLEVKACEDKLLSRFAKSKLGPSYPDPALKDDFVDRCFRNYLKSLKDYSIKSEVREILFFAQGLSAKEKQEAINEGERSYNQKNNVVFLRVNRPDGGVSGFEDVGSGISYILPVLVSLWSEKLSIIEQPELHLHPALQCDLGDVFIAAHRGGASAIIESHSEHILLRVLRRIRETTNGKVPRSLTLKENDVTIYYFEPVKGETIVREIHIDRFGELLDRWPGGFFAERDAELFS